MAIPRVARAGGSERSATYLSAVSGSAAESARAAVLIAESMALSSADGPRPETPNREGLVTHTVRCRDLCSEKSQSLGKEGNDEPRHFAPSRNQSDPGRRLPGPHHQPRPLRLV